MNLLLIRDTFTSTTTLGQLFINGTFECHTLEDADRKLESGGVKIDGKTAIPKGTYKVVIDYSNRFGRDMPHLLDVPQFTGIRIHPGNTAKDTAGCLLVGRLKLSNNTLGYSKDAFAAFFAKLESALEAGESAMIEVR